MFNAAFIQVQLFYSTLHTAQRVYSILMANVSHFGDLFAIQPAFYVEPVLSAESAEPRQPAPPKSYVVLQGLPRAMAKQTTSGPSDSDFVLIDNSDLQQVVRTLLPPNPSISTGSITPPPGGVIFSSEDDWEEIDPQDEIILSHGAPSSAAAVSQVGRSVPFPKPKSSYMQNEIFVNSTAAPEAAPPHELSDMISDIAYSAVKNQSGRSSVPDSSKSDWNSFLQERSARSNDESGSSQVSR